MALLSISVVELFERGKEFNILPESIKNIYTEDNNIVAQIEINKLIPDIKMKVSFDSFSNGKVVFKLKSPAVIKLPAKFIKKGFHEDIFEIDRGNIVFDINKVIEQKTDKVKIKDVDYVNELFTIKI